MRNHAGLNGLNAQITALIQLDSMADFFNERRQVTRLLPMLPSSNAGYVWRRVFLRKRQERG